MKNLSETISDTLKVRAINCLEARTNLNEHLVSLTVDDLLRNLNWVIGDGICKSQKYYTTSKSNKKAIVLEVPVGLINSDLKMKKFLTALDYMMWYKTDDLGRANKIWYVGVEPIETSNVSDKVRSNKYIYHISSYNRTHVFGPDDKLIDTVKFAGLRPKQALYRDFPPRIHFIRHTSEILSDIKTIQRDLRIPKSQLRIFRIDVSKLNNNIVFYWDSMYETDHFVYAFIKFPSEFIEEISITDIN